MAIRNAAKAIIIRDGKVLLNKYQRRNGEYYFDLPGGGQQQYETMEEAVIRECLEETGYRVKVLRFAALAEEIYHDEELRSKYSDYSHRVHHVFFAELAEEVMYKPTETDFLQVECLWLDLEEISNIDLRPVQIREYFMKILNSDAPLYLGSVHIR